MAVGVEHNNEAYGILVDRVGEVLRLGDHERVANPANLDANWKRLSQCVYRLDGNLMITLDTDRFLENNPNSESGA